jgi:hypothetical protein
MKKQIDLGRWLVDFVRFRDSFTKSITGIEEKGTEVIVKRKTGEDRYLVSPDLSDALSGLRESPVSVVTLNTRFNLRQLLQNWHSLSKFPNLTIYFVNPDSGTEKKWIIRPHLHDKVADDDALGPGLESMFSTVEEF